MPSYSQLRLYFLLFALLCASSSYAQSTETEVLLQKVYNAKNDGEKLDAILVVCMRNDIDSETFNELAFVSKALAQKSGDPKKIGMSAYFVAWAHYLNSNNDSARTAIDEALLNINENQTELIDVTFKLKSFKATTYQSEQKNAEALKILFPLLEDIQKSGNKVFTAQTMHLIAIVEGQQKNATKTIGWEKQALLLLDENNANENNVRSTIFATMGKAFMQLNQIDSAIFYNNKAIENFRSTDDLYNLAITLQRQVNLLTNKNDLTNAEIILKELSMLNEKIHMGDGDMNYWMAFINFHIKAKNFNQAISLINDRLEKAGDSSERSATKWGVRLAYFEALAKCYKEQGNDKQYSIVLENILIAKDSLYTINSAEEIASLQTKYEVQKKENTIIEQELQLNRKNAYLYGTLIVFFLISIMIWLHFRNNSRRQKLTMQIQMQEDKMKSALAVREAEENERKRIAADLHDNLGSYAASIVSNIEHLEHTSTSITTLNELKGNSQAMVSVLSDTIWALKKEKMPLTAISDRVKMLLLRIAPSYPEIQMEVKEDIVENGILQPSQAYQLFSIIQEAVNNALKHSKGSSIVVKITSHIESNAKVQIIDNGIGKLESFLSTDSGNGLYNMRHRAEILGWSIQWLQNDSSGIEVEIKQNNTN